MSLIDDLVKLEEEAKELVAGADDAAKLEAARVELLGRKGRITGLMRMMGKLAPEDRPMMGKRANEMRQLIEGMLDERTTEMKAAASSTLSSTRPSTLPCRVSVRRSVTST